MARFEVGDHAPGFSATAYDGNKIRLADFLGKRTLMLFFYPKDGTPICTQEACACEWYFLWLDQAGLADEGHVIGKAKSRRESSVTFVIF